MKNHIEKYRKLFEWELENTSCELVVAPVLREDTEENKLVYYIESDELDENINGCYGCYTNYFTVNYKSVDVEHHNVDILLETIHDIIKENVELKHF